jgi:hypothetical protein
MMRRSGPTIESLLPTETTLEEMVRVAGKRWAVEACLPPRKANAAWMSGHRPITLSLLAHAYLTVVRAQAMGTTLKKAPLQRPQCMNSPECAGDPASAVVPGVAENSGTVIGSGLVPVAAQTPGPSAVLPLPTPQPVRLI